jgi:hypothetical protein
MNACFKGSRANADPDKPKSVVRIVIFERATEPRRRCESQLSVAMRKSPGVAR